MKPLDSLRQELQSILAGKEYTVYHRKSQNILAELLTPLKNWLYSILKRLFPHSNVAQKVSEWFVYGITAVGLLLLALLLYLLLSRFTRQGRINPKQISIAKALTLTVENHFASAQALAEKGEYTLALRHLFLALILYLDQNQLLEAKAWKTNWEYFAELKVRAPRLADSFTVLATKFDEAMYGGRPISENDYNHYLHHVNQWVREGKTN